MARLRIKTRRNPLKPIGALLINPKRLKRRNPPTSRAFAKPYSVKVGAADRQRAYRRRPAAKRKRAVAAFNYTAGRLVMPLAKFRRSRKTRKNGARGIGAYVKPAKRRVLRRARISTRRNPLFLKTNPKRRKARRSVSRRSVSRTRRSRRNPFAARPRVRRMFRRAKARVGVRRARRAFGLKARRNPLFMKTNPLFLRTNGRKGKRRAHTKRRRARKNGFTLFRRNGSGMLGKIPVIGPALASMSTFLMPAAFGAVSVEPVMMAAQLAAPYLPAAMPFSATIALGGVAVGALIKAFAPKTGFISKETANLLAVAAASGAGAIAYWTWRNGDDAPVAEKMGALIVAGYGSPLAGAIMGDANIGSLMLAQNPQFAGYGGFGHASAPAPTMNYAPAGGAAFL